MNPGNTPSLAGWGKFRGKQLRPDFGGHTAPGRGDHLSGLSGHLGGNRPAGSLAIFVEEALSVLCNPLWKCTANTENNCHLSRTNP